MPNATYLVKIAKWKRIKKSVLFIFTLSLIFGLIYPAFADGFGSIYPFFNGIAIGVIGGISISFIEFFVFIRPKKRMNFLSLVLAKALIYSLIFTILVLTVILVSRGIQFGYSNIVDAYYGSEFQHFLYEEDLKFILTYALSLTILIIFIKEISKKVGREVLVNFISGKYYRPKTEDRIFMFLDINDSTTIGERLNGHDYHSFVNEFFKDIGESIITTKGEVYQYIGDEVVVSWSMKKGIKDANCLYTYFYARQTIKRMSEKYLKRFGVVPAFKASIHCGPVIRGEVGDIKSEIVFSGDVLNTTSRIEGLCRSLREPLLISQQLLEKLPDFIKKSFVSKGSFDLKGKEKEFQVYALANNKLNFILTRSL